MNLSNDNDSPQAGGAASPRPIYSSPLSSADWRVLFVGGDAIWFDQVKRDLVCLQPHWRSLHATDAATAIRVLEVQPVDAVVLDSRVPGVRGLIEALSSAGDEILRVLRCDMSDRFVVDSLKGLGVPMVTAHGDATRITASLIRNASLRDWTRDPAIQRLLPQIRKLPAAHDLYSRVSEELNSPHGSLDLVARVICQDPVMSAKMLQIVNSALFGSSREITDMLDAVMILGSERIKSLILLGGLFSQYGESKGSAGLVQSLLAHSIQVGAHARSIALSETRDSHTAEAAFTAGVLHDVGKLILAGNLPDSFAKSRALARTGGLTEPAAEMEVFGVGHALFGACLLAAWGLPLPILDAIAWHHEPAKCPGFGFSLLAAVHVANVFAHESTPNAFSGPREVLTINQDYLINAGLDGCWVQWREACGLPSSQT